MVWERGRHGWSTLGGAFVAVALGVGVVALSGLLYTSGTPRVPERLDAASVVVRSPEVRTQAEPFPPTRPWSSDAADELAGRLTTVDGVRAVVVERDFYAQVVAGGLPVGPIGGRGWSSTVLGGYGLAAGAAPVRPGEVALDTASGFAPGDRVQLLTAAGPARYTVTGLVDGPGIYLADAEAARLSPGVRAIGLVAEPTARLVADVTATVGDAGQVLTGDARSALEPREDARTRWIGSQVLAGMAALAAFVSVFVVASTFAFNANRRRRELGLLRVIGATPRQLRTLLVGEALAVGAAGAAAGVLLGALLAPLVGRALVAAGFEPAGYHVRWQVWPMAAAFALGPVVGVLGAWLALRRAARVRPLEALRESEVEFRPMTRGRWIAGTVFATAGLAALAATAASRDTGDMATFSLLSTMALVVAATVLSPAVVPAVVRALTWPARNSRRATAMLVRQSALTAVRRTGSTAAPVLLTVTFAVLITGSVQTQTSVYAASRAGAVRAGSVLTPVGGGPGLSDAAVGSVAGVSGLMSNVYPADTVVSAVGIDPVAFAAASNRLTVLDGDLADLAGPPAAAESEGAAQSEGAAEGEGPNGNAAPDRVAVSQGTAKQFGWRLGGQARMTLADGIEAAPRVVAIVSDGSVPAGVLLSRAVVRAHDPSALTSAVFMSGPAPAQTPVGARVVDVATYAAEADAEEDRLVWLATLLLVAVSAGYGAIAVANTLFLAADARRRDFRVLRLSGAPTAQVCVAVAAESVLVVAIGSVLGGAVASVALWGGLASMRARAGVPVDIVVPWPTIAVTVAACLVLALVASVVPTRNALGRTAIDHTQS